MWAFIETGSSISYFWLTSEYGEMGIPQLLSNPVCMRHVYSVLFCTERNPGQPTNINDQCLPGYITEMIPGMLKKTGILHLDLYLRCLILSDSTGEAMFTACHTSPACCLHSMLKEGTRRVERPQRRFKDVLKRDLKIFELHTNSWAKLSLNRDFCAGKEKDSTDTLEKPRRCCYRTSSACCMASTTLSDTTAISLNWTEILSTLHSLHESVIKCLCLTGRKSINICRVQMRVKMKH